MEEKKAQEYTGQVENPARADSVLEAVTLMAAVGMYGPKVTDKRLAFICSSTTVKQQIC